MAIIDHELSAKVAQMLEQFKVVARTRKCLSTNEAVRQLQHGITTAAKSPRSPSIKSEDLRDVKEESIESDVEGIEAIQTTVSPAESSSAAAEVALCTRPNAMAGSATHAQEARQRDITLAAILQARCAWVRAHLALLDHLDMEKKEKQEEAARLVGFLDKMPEFENNLRRPC
ncbi:uncharacterized protein BBA_03027 [Beauveria bassiana ARSEF 2860]|uniref:Uncharacterized protein n=1 Tax=Beauveria bassiana (strain ARSEF 2860) TaxID=655819 RepID=J5K1S3_BEAB2|nr:uncharacterized protein BBA_03027 [Beauveria bassiana ARSEF 2860]EJP68131.1 hypothetical protein BBA_03027 [Beauveria bassiana ARSEF 2860]